MAQMLVLSGVTGEDSSTVLGVYSNSDEMNKHLTEWHKTKTPLQHYFYEVIDTDAPAEWANEQRAIYPDIINR